MNASPQSTIVPAGVAPAFATVLARRLRSRTATLPWSVRAGFWLLPPRCIACGGEGDLGAIDLCAACLETWPHRAADEPGIAFDYREPVAAALRALKFDGDRRPARVLGSLLALRIAEFVARRQTRLPVAIVPIALHAERLRTRGFDQALMLATHTGRWLGIPVRRWLQRTRFTSPQTELDAPARRRNVRDAFAAAPAAVRALQRVVASPPLCLALLDDVTTTGATMAAAADALQAAARAAGVAIEIQCWAVAATAKSSAMPTNTTKPM